MSAFDDMQRHRVVSARNALAAFNASAHERPEHGDGSHAWWAGDDATERRVGDAWEQWSFTDVCTVAGLWAGNAELVEPKR